MARLRLLRDVAPDRRTWKQDLVAGVPGAISSVPAAMAASVLAGVSPVQGLHASIFGRVGGGLASSSRLMVVTTTGASALAAGSAVSGVAPQDRGRALVLLTLIAGALMVVAGFAKLGRWTRFVPHSVMIGFLTGVAATMLLGQLPDLVGAEASGDTALTKDWHLLMNLDTVSPAALGCGAGALAILATLGRTRFAPYAALVALVVPSAVVLLAGADSVPLVGDRGEIPGGLPSLVLPHVSDLSVPLVLGACAVAVVVLVQGAGVGESTPNPDGTHADPDQDFVGQGAGNLLSGLFGGQPVGGAVGQTALSVAAGARSRWAAIFAGMWMLVILVVFAAAVGNVVMATLAAVLIMAAVGSFRAGDMGAILRTSRMSQIAALATFAATLVMPMASAVGFGVTVALLMQLNREALDLRVVALHPGPGNTLVEGEAPATLRSREVVLLDVYGSLFFAGARTVRAYLPDPAGTRHPAVVLRLRGRAMLGSTSFAVLADYAARLAAVEGRFYLSGLDPAVHRQLRANRSVGEAGEVHVFEASKVLGESSLAAYEDAEAWLALVPPDPDDEADGDTRDQGPDLS